MIRNFSTEILENIKIQCNITARNKRINNKFFGIFKLYSSTLSLLTEVRLLMTNNVFWHRILATNFTKKFVFTFKVKKDLFLKAVVRISFQE